VIFHQLFVFEGIQKKANPQPVRIWIGFTYYF